MLAATYPVNASPTAASAEEASVMTPISTNSNRPAPRGIPSSIPSDELFFWTEDWQASEARADEDVHLGRVASFANAHEAIRHLLSDR